MQLYPADTANALLTDDGISSFLFSVGYDAHNCPAGTLPADSIQALLRMLCNCGTKGRSTATAETIVELHNMVLALQEHDDRGVRQLAAQGAQLFE